MRLVRKKAGGSQINTEGWMMSYADMATTLLAMFIVLSTLGKDQTGISLYNGTGSFMQALDSFGLPGFFANSARVVPLHAPGPHYPDPHGGDGAGGRAPNPDPDGSPRVIDLEEEQLQGALQEIGRQIRLDRLPDVTGWVELDFYDRLNRLPPYLTAKQSVVLWQALNLLTRRDYEATLVVWAAMPSGSAWLRAANQAEALADELRAARPTGALAALKALGQPWRSASARRPVFSLVLSKTAEGP